MASARMVTQHIEVALETADTCVLCSREGTLAYRGLHDYTFGAAGAWDYRECPRCGLLWLSPRPLPAEMGKFYATYLTHAAKNDHIIARRLNDKLKLALWARALRSPALVPNWFWAQIARISSLDPFFREIGNIGTMYLGGIKPGRVLDVGCGNGSFLAVMQSAGWDIAGLDPDPKAAALATERLGANILAGDLYQASFPRSSFDAVTLHHVIEHIFDPIETLAECRRILKPGGQVVVMTPNLLSAGHKWFKANWRGLEPPRHLHLFSAKALATAAEMAGIRIKLLRTSACMAPGIWLESHVISRRRSGAPERQGSLMGGLAFLAWERAVKTMRPESGEEVVLVGTAG